MNEILIADNDIELLNLYKELFHEEDFNINIFEAGIFIIVSENKPDIKTLVTYHAP
ncbi:MAG TPA: hypothetical protein PL110_16535 [Candidatus Eremiobacteraeota bacterium]|nr:MAG: hypothetical protein BWY64_01425 [bacterium ADurb.Bin363]HPZ09709.1 hypothetical protein [Candidatus Eremiobacteraeota bacterium]